MYHLILLSKARNGETSDARISFALFRILLEDVHAGLDLVADPEGVGGIAVGAWRLTV